MCLPPHLKTKALKKRPRALLRQVTVRLAILHLLPCSCPHLSQILDVQNVMVVVSRWYGGILLGPDRFKHICNCARAILVQGGYVDLAVSNSFSLVLP